jgi:hypothetical protein
LIIIGRAAVVTHTGSSASADVANDAAAPEAVVVAANTPPPATLQAVVLRRNDRGSGNAIRIPAPSGRTGVLVTQFGEFPTQLEPQQAGTTLLCADHAFHVTTGTAAGTCTTDFAAGSGACVDGSNSSTASCRTGCGTTTGAGDCTQS